MYDGPSQERFFKSHEMKYKEAQRECLLNIFHVIYHTFPPPYEKSSLSVTYISAADKHIRSFPLKWPPSKSGKDF